MDYYPSKYNFFFDFPNSDQKLAFNSRTTALALLENEKFIQYNSFLKGNPISDSNLISNLEFGGFIIDSSISEADLMRNNLYSTRYSSKTLGITIAPTLNCNLRCIYCYEKDNMDVINMSAQVQDKIIEIIKGQANSITHLGITWYGGEPLIALDIIKNLSTKFIEICDSNHISYSAGIITNGLLLTHEKAKLLKELRITFAQITLDGPKDIHDLRRPAANGLSTFDKILENIGVASEYLDRISVRVNVDQNNKDRSSELIHVFKEKNMKENVSLYLGRVHDSNDCYNSNICISSKEYSEASYAFDKEAYENGVKNNYLSYPSLSVGCTANRTNSLVIDPEGFLYNCWVEIGDKKLSSGSIIDKTFLGNKSLYLKYMLEDPLNHYECKECKFLPFCMGGCPNKRYTQLNSEYPDDCTNYKYNLEKKLIEFASYLILQRNKQKTLVD